MTRILGIDDDAAFRSVLTRLLTQSGYDVLEATNGNEGLQRLADSTPDVLLVDIFMPEQDEIETIRLVRQAFPQVPILAMSGGAPFHHTGDVLVAARAFGAWYTFTKPHAPEALLAALRTVTGS
jgi:CheY-like chemotaxis protein